MDWERLKEAGLSENESRIYLSLLRSEPLNIALITERSNVHRRNVYDALERLVKKGLVSWFVKNNRRYFQAEDPEKLLELLHEKEKSIERLLGDLKAIRREGAKSNVRVFEAKEGLKFVFNDILDSLGRGEEYVAFGITGKAYEQLGVWYKNYLLRRKAKGVRARLIFNAGARNSASTKLPLAEVRFASEEAKSLTAVFMYKGKVAQMIWGEDLLSTIVVLIENENIANSFRSYFEWLWEVSES